MHRTGTQWTDTGQTRDRHVGQRQDTCRGQMHREQTKHRGLVEGRPQVSHQGCANGRERTAPRTGRGRRCTRWAPRGWGMRWDALWRHVTPSHALCRPRPSERDLGEGRAAGQRTPAWPPAAAASAGTDGTRLCRRQAGLPAGRRGPGRLDGSLGSWRFRVPGARGHGGGHAGPPGCRPGPCSRGPRFPTGRPP